MPLLSVTNMPFNLPLTRETDKTIIAFVVTYSTRGGVLKLCTMLENVARKV